MGYWSWAGRLKWVVTGSIMIGLLFLGYWVVTHMEEPGLGSPWL